MANKVFTTKAELVQNLVDHLAGGVHYADFAEQVDVSKWKIYKLIKGLRFILDLDDAVKIAEGLGYELKFEKRGGE